MTTNTHTETQEAPMTNHFNIGDKVALRNAASLRSSPPYKIPVGTRGTVTEVRSDGDHNVVVTWDEPVAASDERMRTGTTWAWHPDWFELVATPARPTVKLTKAVSLAHAADLLSRAGGELKPAFRADLEALSLGLEVDAYDANAAIVQLLGVLPGRRGGKELASKARHLHYIVQGILTNHADALPAYAEGERSRAVAESKTALEAARLEVEALTQELERQKSFVEQAEAATAMVDRQLTASRRRVAIKAEVIRFAIAQAGTDTDAAGQIVGFEKGLRRARPEES